MTTTHCIFHDSPDVLKFEAGDNNLVALPEGTLFCVKGGTDSSGMLISDGSTPLVEYLGNGHDVSYYVIYPEPEAPSTTTTTTGPAVTTTTTAASPTTTTLPLTTSDSLFQSHLGTECVTPDGWPYTTSYPECPPAIAEVPVTPAPLTELPRTGQSMDLALIGIVLVLWGIAFYFVSKWIKGR